MLNGDYERDGAYEGYTKGNPTVPKPPKPGEIMICQWCQTPILPEQLANEKNLGQRKRCFKWHLHPDCYFGMGNQVDRAVPGLLTERKQLEEKQKKEFKTDEEVIKKPQQKPQRAYGQRR